MPAIFIPPTQHQAVDHWFWGRFGNEVGVSVLLTDGHYKNHPVPSQEEIQGLEQGVDYFLGGYEYPIELDVANALIADGYDVNLGPGYGNSAYGNDDYGV